MKGIAVALLLLGCLPCAHPQDLRDPTRPPVTAAIPPRHEASPAGPRVTAVFVSIDRRVATFDGQPVHVGDRVGDCLIEEITSAGVRYRAQGQSVFAALQSAPP